MCLLFLQLFLGLQDRLSILIQLDWFDTHELIELLLHWDQCVVDLLLVVGVDLGHGEEPNPDQEEDCDPVEPPAKVGQSVHA